MGFSDAFLKNKWLWFHIFAGGLLAKLLLVWFTPQLTVIMVLSIALMWEFYEYMHDDIKVVYGDKKRFFLDAIGDVTGAVAMAIVVVI